MWYPSTYSCIILVQLYYNVANGVWTCIVMRWPGGVIGQKSGRCRLNDPSQLMPHPDYITIHNTNMCMWALSHIYTYLICDTQTYRRTGQRSASGSNTILTLLFPHYQHQEVAGWCIFYTWWVGNLRILPLDAISLWQLSFFAPFIRLFIPKTAIFHSISIFPK